VSFGQADALRRFPEAYPFEVVHLHPTLTAAPPGVKSAEFHRQLPFDVTPRWDKL
jgi:hypothetical protein